MSKEVEQRVVEMIMYQIQEVLAVAWRFVVEGNTDVTFSSFKKHF